MDIIELINKKKIGKKLSNDEWKFFVQGVCSKKIKDYQASAMLMAIFVNGLDFDETFNFTMAMAQSGKMLNLDDVGICFDKHSTGGVSDTTTIVIVPILASLGIKVAKMSGRSLGWTGGTADKMEVFKGYNTQISTDKFKKLIKENNASIITQSDDSAVADKILYKLRSQTGTVDSMPLIASSIMSKKIACGAKIVLLDVKYGNGAFMKTIKDAKKLAKLMVEIGKKANIKVCAVISNMNQPLTEFIGNNFEVYSALKVLDGEDNNLSKLSKFICQKAIRLFDKNITDEHAFQMIDNAIEQKKAKQKLKEIVKSQGGDTKIIENKDLLIPKNNKFEIYSKNSGYVYDIDTSKLGYIVNILQMVDGEFVRQDDVGIILNKRLGDCVKSKESLLTVYYNKLNNIDEIKEKLNDIFKIGSKKVKSKKLVECVIE